MPRLTEQEKNEILRILHWLDRFHSYYIHGLIEVENRIMDARET